MSRTYVATADGPAPKLGLLDAEGNEFCLGGGAWPGGVESPSEVSISLP